MRKIASWVAMFVAVFVVGASAQDQVRLQFELRRGDAVVARPVLSLSPGSEGALDIDGVGTIKVTPTLLADDRVSLSFDIRTSSRQAKPRLVLLGGTTGSLTISPEAPGGEPLGISVTWQR